MDIVAAFAVFPERQCKSVRREKAGIRIKFADRRRRQIILRNIARTAVSISLTRMRSWLRPFGQAGSGRGFAVKGIGWPRRTGRQGEEQPSPNQSSNQRAMGFEPEKKRLDGPVQAAPGRIAAIRRLNGAETWWRSIASRRSPSEVTQLNWMTRRSPAKGLWPCQELSPRLNAKSVPSVGGTSVIASSRLSADFSSRRRPPGCSQPAFM